MDKLRLRLYTMDGYSSSTEAIKCINEILQFIPNNKYSFEIIDMIKNPRKTEEDNVLVAPTLIRFNPLPIKRLVGSFQDAKTVRKELDIPNIEDEGKNE